MSEREIRSIAAEIRGGAGRQVEGYASVFNSPTKIGGLFREVVRPGAFTRSLASGASILFLAFHDMTKPLARSGGAGGLDLAEDTKGLHFRATLPNTRDADDVLELARKGILTGASFGFSVPANGDAWTADDTRELLDVTLHEISAVVDPAYPETTIAARARQHASTSRRAHAFRLRALEL